MDPPPAKVPAPPGLVDALLDAAGRSGPWRVLDVPTVGRVNTTTLVEGPRCGRLAVRVEGWPFPHPCPFDRRAKEARLLPTLAAAGVPVPQVLAVADHDGQRGALHSCVEGETLGAVARREPVAALERAWGEAAAALRRVHDLDPSLVGAPPPPHPALGRGPGPGWLTAGAVVPFADGDPAERVARQLHERAALLRAADRISADERRRIDALAVAALPALRAAPRGVAHGDANPWNVLVRRDDTDGGWRLSGWLDWEFAVVADPVDDHVRAATQRFAPIGPPPAAWWEGYGRPVDPLLLAVRTLHHLLGRWTQDDGSPRSPEIVEAAARRPDLPALLREAEERSGL